MEQGGVRRESVLQELAQVAFGTAGDGSGAQLKYSNKLKALELLAKLLGMFDPESMNGAEPVVIVDDLGEG